MMKVVAFTGMPGAGKTEAIHIAQTMGLTVTSMGDIVRAEAQHHNLADDDTAIGSFADSMRQQHGKDIWAHKCLENLPATTNVVIDGIRNIEEIEAFKHKLPNFILVAIHTSPQTRYQRLIQRKRADDSISIDDIKKREHRELSWGLGDVIAMADIMVSNESDMNAFRKKITSILTSIFE